MPLFPYNALENQAFLLLFLHKCLHLASILETMEESEDFLPIMMSAIDDEREVLSGALLRWEVEVVFNNTCEL